MVVWWLSVRPDLGHEYDQVIDWKQTTFWTSKEKKTSMRREISFDSGTMLNTSSQIMMSISWLQRPKPLEESPKSEALRLERVSWIKRFLLL